MKRSFRITRLFIGGLLKGLTHTEVTSVEFDVGFESKGVCGTSPYRIISVEEIR